MSESEIFFTDGEAYKLANSGTPALIQVNAKCLDRAINVCCCHPADRLELECCYWPA